MILQNLSIFYVFFVHIHILYDVIYRRLAHCLILYFVLFFLLLSTDFVQFLIKHCRAKRARERERERVLYVSSYYCRESRRESLRVRVAVSVGVVLNP